MNIAQGKALKRNRHSYYWDFNKGDYVRSLEEPNEAFKGAGHIPNKNESKLLRRICAQTGLSPEEVRQHKKYRQQLAEKANEFTPKAAREIREMERRYREKYKGMTPEQIEIAQMAERMKLPVGHNAVQKAYREMCMQRDMDAVMAKLSEPW